MIEIGRSSNMLGHATENFIGGSTAYDLVGSVVSVCFSIGTLACLVFLRFASSFHLTCDCSPTMDPTRQYSSFVFRLPQKTATKACSEENHDDDRTES